MEREILAAGRRIGLARIVSFDMGGTSTDVSLADGEPRRTTEFAIDGLPVALPVLDILTVGAGGGSIARVDEGRALVVGPESAGAVPGPIAYDRGGEAIDGFSGDVERNGSEVRIGVMDLGECGYTVDPLTVDIDAEIRRTTAPPAQKCGDRSDACRGSERKDLGVGIVRRDSSGKDEVPQVASRHPDTGHNSNPRRSLSDGIVQRIDERRDDSSENCYAQEEIEYDHDGVSDVGRPVSERAWDTPDRIEQQYERR